MKKLLLTLLIANACSTTVLASDLTSAISKGNAYLVDTVDELYTAIDAQVITTKNLQTSFINGLYPPNTAINYNAGQNSQIFNIYDISRTFPVLMGSAKNTNLAIAGTYGNGRFLAWGTNVPARLQAGDMSGLERVMDNSLRIALKTTITALSANKKVSIVMMSGTDLTRTQQWLQARFPLWTINVCNDAANLATCIASANLIISGDSIADTAASGALANVLARVTTGVGLVYFHNRWSTNAYSNGLMQTIGAEMPYAGNWFNGDYASWSNKNPMMLLDMPLKQVGRLVGHLKNQDFPSFDWSKCVNNVGTVSCDAVPQWNSEFVAPASYLRNSLRQLDQSGTSLFQLQGYRLLKMFVLLGDKLRTQIDYPLDKQTNPYGFYKAYLADHLNSYVRSLNPRQEDLGTFANHLNPTPTTTSKELVFNLGTNPQSVSTGLYALAGMPLKVVRTDTTGANVGLYLNSIRSGSTRAFNSNGLARPKYLQTPTIPTTTITKTIISPYGGAVYLNLPAGTGQVKMRMVGVTMYPYLSNINNTTLVNNFQTTLATTPYDWAGIKTDFVDINSRVSMLKQTINSAPYNGDLKKAFADIWTYMIKGTYDLAGFTGDGLALPTAVQNKCTALGWDCTSTSIHAKPVVQHITVDTMAHCGSGCSGNPYDQDWPLSPMGWGESHEIGHNLQRERLKIYSGKSTEVSNNLFPSYKGWQYYQATGLKVEHCSRGNDTKMYTWLQEAKKTTDAKSAMYTKLWSQTGTYDNAFERLAFYLQLAYAADTLATLQNGWQIYTLMYLHERLFTEAIKSSTAWTANSVKLGFGTYSAAPTSMNGNDFMLISYSYLTAKDQRPLFDAWGITYSDAANQQVASYGFMPATVVYYGATEHCSTLKVAARPVDGVTVWP
ncbi:ImpA family metalloprotease [Agitococcus lubricus]|uniref:Enhancin-like peptidase M60 family n=1 Tax=Agitococcus lubricus TaxID=1077255 RepID=A0A2T5J1H7_9GAMM|nr:ImpA family metalloprotease [Agitococcus lubricus]PTQ90149.1 enhancin-like peptidase M60 family [Agitococcus lubricus]